MAGVLGGAGLIINYLFVADDTAELIAVVVVVCVLFVFILFTIVRQYQVARKEKYANVTDRIHSVLHNIRDVTSFLTHCHENHEPS